MEIFGRKHRNIKRYREILYVLSKYGFTMLVEQINIDSPIRSLFFTKILRVSKKYTRGQRIRMALEELGPTFVKLGQILSTRYDLLPEDIVEELMYLQDKVKEFSFETAKEIFYDETGKTIDEVFEIFDQKPIAAASIGQVYRGTLKNKENVVIKIQRPNIAKIIKKDMEVLHSMAHIVDERFNKTGMIRAVDIIRELSYSIHKELDYTYEAQNAHKFGENFKDNKNAVIPKIYWDYTTKRVVVMEEIKGIKISDIEEIERRNWDKSKIGKIGASLFMEQVFIHGLFHGDPHPGNILIVDKEKIGFIDFGIVGYMDDGMLSFIISLLKSSQEKDVNKIVDTLFKVDAITTETDELDLRKDIYYIITYYFDLPINRINFGEALNEILLISYKHKLKIPSQLTLLIKSLITIEGTSRKLDPNFSFSEISEETIREISKKKLKLNKGLMKASKISFEIYEGLKDLPRQINTILSKIEKNQIKITMKQEGLKQLEEEVNNMTTRTSLSILTAAIIVGSSIVIHSDINPKIYGISAFGIVGYLGGVVLGFGLLLSILLERKKNK
ncbi:ubiquinone biosynthesis protein UbiB [Gottschalkia purinilytica]|uniref:Ubiquinone biosynthesis protein UbiB n=1 Tax=Gottschalkia purinilytica TaxID=1503 RepID=A0A0L0WB19_GOTPU|nr:AarF/UbiB family protein [Gottschalkia purinilytica]KNF08696.1 ubiquinone biosynthesis protein UbiB [Gottschalkia purinilytica]